MKANSFAGTMRLIKGDLDRRISFFGHKKSFRAYINFLLLPGTTAVIIYRLSHYLYCKRFLRPVGRILYMLNIFLTGADIAPQTEIGKGFLLFHPVATIINGKLGENIIMSAHSGTGGSGTKDIGGGPGLPVIGNNVMVGARVSILGPIMIGDGVNILAGAIVVRDIPAHKLVAGFSGRPIKTIPPDYNMFASDTQDASER